AIAWIYVRYGSLPQVGWLFYGIQPVVVAIIAQAIWNLGRIIVKGPLAFIIALLVLVLYLLGMNVLILLFGGAILFGILHFLQARSNSKVPPTNVLLFSGIKSWRVAWKGLGAATLTTGASFSLLMLFLTFLKFGAVVYGSGYTLLAFLRADLVQNLHWLTDKQLLDAISIGQFTPGPVFTTATFIGYILAGWPGALLATLGIFLPSFLFIPLIHPVAAHLRQVAWTAMLFVVVNVAVLSLMGGVLVLLGLHALIDVLTWAVALVSFATLL